MYMISKYTYTVVVVVMAYFSIQYRQWRDSIPVTS